MQCLCGCGVEAKPSRTYLWGHHRRPYIDVCKNGHLMSETRKVRPSKRTADGTETYCSECAKANGRKATRKYRYGVANLPIIDAFTESQTGLCAICGNGNNQNRTLLTDHQHGTGKIRGMLCGNCNSGLGMFQDDPIRITKALEYLSRRSW